MPEDTVPVAEVPKPKRKYTRHKPLKKAAPKVAVAVKPEAAIPLPRRFPEKALAEIDDQLQTAIACVPRLEDELAVIDGKQREAQSRLERVRRQIGELMRLQQQIAGVPVQNVVAPPPELDPRVASMVPGAQWQKDIPPGVSSIPAKQPKPSNGNVADQAKGPGWE